MRSNKFIKAAGVMTAMALATTFAMSGTVAKYTSAVNATDGATVASFDYSVFQTEEVVEEVMGTSGAPTVIDLFGTTQNDTGVINSYNLGVDGTDMSADGYKLIAPGVGGYFQLQFNNESEVAMQFNVWNIELTNEADVPLMFYFNGNWYSDVVIEDKDGNVATEYYIHADSPVVTIAGDMSDLQTAINNYYTQESITYVDENGDLTMNNVGGEKYYGAAILNANETGTIEIAWAWPYEITFADGTNAWVNDGYDTAIAAGSETAAMGEEEASVSLYFGVRATQMDVYAADRITTTADETVDTANVVGYASAYDSVVVD